MSETEKDEALAAFKALEWDRMDWQGVCPFRRHQDVRCQGTDGVRSGFGTPTPRPHADACPYSLLAKMEAK